MQEKGKPNLIRLFVPFGLVFLQSLQGVTETKVGTLTHVQLEQEVNLTKQVNNNLVRSLKKMSATQNDLRLELQVCFLLLLL